MSATETDAPAALDVELFDRLLEQKGATTDIKRAELLNCDRITVWRWRHGKLKPSLDQALRFATFFDVSVEELFPRPATSE